MEESLQFGMTSNRTSGIPVPHPTYYKCMVEMTPDLFSPPRTDFQTFLPTSPFTSPILASSVLSPVQQPLLAMQEQPATGVNPQSRFLDRLYSNPMFEDLQRLLAQECLHMQVPTNLITHTWTVTGVQQTQKNNVDVYGRHVKLQEKFLKLRSNDLYRSEGLHIESEYSARVGEIEVARYQALCAAGASAPQRHTVNIHFDEKRIDLIEIYEKELEKLQRGSIHHSASDPVQTKLYNLDSTLHDSNEIRKCKAGVARQLDFPGEDMRSNDFGIENMQDEYSSAASSPECLEVDISEDSHYVNNEVSSREKSKMSLCDSGVCDDDDDDDDNDDDESCLSTLDHTDSVPPGDMEGGYTVNMWKKSRTDDIPYVNENKGNELKNCPDENVFVSNAGTARQRAASAEKGTLPQINSDVKVRGRSEDVKVRGRSKQLSAYQTDILTAWYMDHIRYPYPSDLEVIHLSGVTGLRQQQVKKWMANKRVRNYNTLSISGNQHPIKFKFKGTRVCDVKSMASKPNYRQLNPESRRILNEWYNKHSENPYPSDDQRKQLAEDAGISELQVKSWFANKRSRAQNTKRQIPNYFIKKFPEYTSHVHMVSIGREMARKAKKRNYETVNGSSGYYMH